MKKRVCQRKKKKKRVNINPISVFTGAERMLRRLDNGEAVQQDDVPRLDFLAFVLKDYTKKLRGMKKHDKTMKRIRYFFSITFSANRQWLPNRSFEQKVQTIITELKRISDRPSEMRKTPDPDIIKVMLGVVSHIVDDIFGDM